MKCYKHLILVTLWLFLLPALLNGQRTDYDAFPQLNANTIHMELNLQVQEQPLLMRGEVLYTLRLMRQGVDRLALDAIRMDIERVEWNGNEAGFRIEDDKLYVELPENESTSRDHRLRIRYRAEPEFGVHLSESGSIWSSTLPGSVRHWLPVMDHPRNRFTTDVSLIFSTEKSGVFSGVPGEETAESLELKKAQFYSDSEIPASSLTFAVGRFKQQQASSGRHRIDLYYEEGTLDEEGAERLLETAREVLSRSAELFRSTYHSRTLSLVILSDDRWELKPYGAGMVFGYHQLPELPLQIASGVAGQWAGIQLQEERWEESQAIRMLQAWLMNRYQELLPQSHNQEDGNWLVSRESVYYPYTPQSLRSWRHWIGEEENASYRRLFQQRIGSLLSDLPSVITWYDFALWAYRQTGLSMIDPPEPVQPYIEVQSDPARYRVRFDVGEEGRLRLYFEAEGNPIDELVTVTAEEVTRQERRVREITFTGSSDEVVINVSPSVENLLLRVDGDQNVSLVPDKPFEFWFHQLRNEEAPDRRIEAAVALRQFYENPDLQLALLDILGHETEPAVQAEMLRTLAAVTAGATGTDQLFRQRFSRNQDPVLQESIVEAYGNYPENETIISQLRTLILNPTHPAVQRQATRSLARVADEDRFRSMSSALLDDEAARPVVPILLRELAERDMQEAIRLASPFLGAQYPFHLREEILDFLLEEDRSSSRWDERSVRLLYDRDPRIRFKALEGLEFLPSARQQELIEERQFEEYDDRVIRLLQQRIR